MTVEIKELIIKSIIEEAYEHTDTISVEDMELIIESCVKQMKYVLAEEQQR